MTTIHRFDRALESLRQKLAERSPTGKSGASASTQSSTKPATAGSNALQLKQRIRERIASLDLDQRSGQEKGTAIFLETVLAFEFGADLLADPAFHDMIAEVRDTMLGDQPTQQDLVAMLQALKASD